MSDSQGGRQPEHATIKQFYDEDYHRDAGVGARLPWHQR